MRFKSQRYTELIIVVAIFFFCGLDYYFSCDLLILSNELKGGRNVSAFKDEGYDKVPEYSFEFYIGETIRNLQTHIHTHTYNACSA